MPQPIRHRPGDRTEGGYEQLAKRPECALRIAQVASAWAWLELHLSDMFSLGTGSIARKESGTTIWKTNRIARASFHALDSLNARLRIIEASLEIVAPEKVASFNEIAADVRRCATGRNKVVHSCWSISDRYPDDVVRTPALGGHELWTAKDFQNIIEQIEAQSIQILMFLMEVRGLIEKAPPSEPSE